MPMPDDVREHREWLLALLRVPPGGHVLDLDCGRGEDLLRLAALHPHPALRFTGLDASERSIAAARDVAAGDPRVARVRHHLAGPLPFPDASVDAVFSHNLLECLRDPAALVRETARVLRPGGSLVVAHRDWDSQLWDGDDRALVRRVVHAFADWQQGWMEHADWWTGRRLHGLFTSSGAFAGGVHARVLANTAFAAPWYVHARAQDVRSLVRHERLAADDAGRFLAERARLHAAGRYVYGITGFAQAGRRA